MLLAGILVWGPPSFVVAALAVYFIFAVLGQATSQKCPSCLGIVNPGASKCVNCGSDLPPLRKRARKKPIELLVIGPKEHRIGTAVVAFLSFAIGGCVIGATLFPGETVDGLSSGAKALVVCLVVTAIPLIPFAYYILAKPKQTSDPMEVKWDDNSPAAARSTKGDPVCPKCLSPVMETKELGQSVYNCGGCGTRLRVSA